DKPTDDKPSDDKPTDDQPTDDPNAPSGDGTKAEGEIEGTLCYDGTIAEKGDKCPIVPSCKMGQYRCENSGCANLLENCPIDELYVCPNGQMKCPDGMCHENCNKVRYHGCLVGQYQCTNGLCVNDKYDCIGYSMCPDPAFPFRCINSECKATPEDCEIIERLGSVKNFTYSFRQENKVAFSFAFDTNHRTIGKMEIPASGLSLDRDVDQLIIEEVSSDLLYKQHLYNASSFFLFNVSNTIRGSEGILTFENSVLSPVFKFYSKNKKIKFRLNGVLTISHNTYSQSGFYHDDYCLAKLKGWDLEKDTLTGAESEQRWECVERKNRYDQEDFKINEFGVYAMIVNPSRNAINYFGTTEAKNFFIENIKIILFAFLGICVLFALVFYIFMRVSRYREKYHENRKKIELLQAQKREYENMTTDIFGQTLGDNIMGLVYKANPCYQISEDNRGKSCSLEEEIENLQVQCKNVENQNARLQEKIDDLNEKYKTITAEIEAMNDE
ncbi:MAG: hypothetical protein MJ221_05020, partial [Bacilli bacterium]|nr:hypothetical protein [Bacilli bacterium]